MCRRRQQRVVGLCVDQVARSGWCAASEASIAAVSIIVEALPADKGYTRAVIGGLINSLTVAKRESQLQAVTSIREVLCREDPPVQTVIDSGIVPRLVRMLTSPDKRIQIECAWALTNVAVQDAKVIVECGALTSFVRLWTSTSDVDLKEQIAWGIGNIAGESGVLREDVTRTGIHRLMIDLANTHIQHVALGQTVVWTLSNLLRGTPRPQEATVRDILPYMMDKFVNTPSDQVPMDVCWALYYATQDPYAFAIEAMLKRPGLVPRLIHLILHGNVPRIRSTALRTMGNIVCSTENHQTQVMIDAGVIDVLQKVLATSSSVNHQNAVWVISNILTGTHDQIQAVLDADILPNLTKLLLDRSPSTIGAHREAVWSFCNGVQSGTKEQALQFISSPGALAELCKLCVQSDRDGIRATVCDSLCTLAKIKDARHLFHSLAKVDCSMIEEWTQHADAQVRELGHQLFQFVV